MHASVSLTQHAQAAFQLCVQLLAVCSGFQRLPALAAPLAACVLQSWLSHPFSCMHMVRKCCSSSSCRVWRPPTWLPRIVPDIVWRHYHLLLVRGNVQRQRKPPESSPATSCTASPSCRRSSAASCASWRFSCTRRAAAVWDSCRAPAAPSSCASICRCCCLHAGSWRWAAAQASCSAASLRSREAACMPGW